MIPQEADSPPPKGPRKKNTIVSLPHTAQPADDDDEDESISAEATFDKAQGPKVDSTPINK